MRRKDREMDRAFALEVLDRCEWAVLAMTDEAGLPYCVPLTIVREGDTVYFHGALSGEKADCLHRNGRVCLTAVGDTRIPPDNFTTEFESAVARGQAEALVEDEEKLHALRLLCRRHVPTHMDAFEEAALASLRRTGVWRFKIDSITGKRKKYGPDGQELKFGRME